jgi:hypothetical protein
MDPLHEPSRRRPGWDEDDGLWIELAEGSWVFPRPWIDPRPVIDGTRRPVVGTTFGPEFDAKVRAMRAARDGAETLQAMYAVAADLLTRNYNLSPAELARLLHWRRKEDDINGDNEWMWTCIVNVAVGKGERNYERWQRVAALVAMNYSGPLPLEDLMDMISWGVGSGRGIVPADRWAEELIEEASQAANRMFMNF